MRTTLFVLATALLVTGCDPAKTAGADMAVRPDLAGTGPALDMTLVVKNGCSGYIQCLIDCGSDTACNAACDKNVTTKGMNLYNTALACGQDWCLAFNDIGSGDCTLNSAMDMLIDPPGKPANTCSNCLNNSLAGLFGDTCSPTTSPNCNPASCTAANTACAASTP